MSAQLVLSLFPGVDLLGMAFAAEGFCVVSGPELMTGRDIRDFHVPPGRFDGVIGGPPCQIFSRFRFLNPHAGKHGNLIPEFERVVREARPFWYVMENVEGAPVPCVEGYLGHPRLLRDDWVGGATTRLRRFTFGCREPRPWHIEELALHSAELGHAVVGDSRPVPVALNAVSSNGKRKRTLVVHGGHTEPFDRPRLSVQDMLDLQGAPRDLLGDAPFTEHGKRQMIGNGVPLPMGRAVAKAVKRALGMAESVA